MCRRSIRILLSSDQLDRMTDASNGPRSNAADGFTHYVNASAPAGGDGTSSTSQFQTTAEGLAAAGDGDIVLLRVGNYDEPMIIDQHVTLRATRGNVRIGEP